MAGPKRDHGPEAVASSADITSTTARPSSSAATKRSDRGKSPSLRNRLGDDTVSVKSSGRTSGDRGHVRGSGPGLGPSSASSSSLTSSSASNESSPVRGTGAGSSSRNVANYGSITPPEPEPEMSISRTDKMLAYFKTPQFWIVLGISQSLALCMTGTNTFSSLLAQRGISAPAFQNLINYIVLNAIYTTYTLYRYGFKKWWSMVVKDGWKYFIFAFLDVEANYFIVLAYRHTTILSIQLLNFTAIVTVVVLSFSFLKVRYRPPQIAGIVICCAGMGVLIASDTIQRSNNNPAPDPNPVKGDLFALLAATLYGMTNTYEEFALSQRPLYEVIGQLAFWGSLVSGVQAAIFDRSTVRHATWSPVSVGYLVGYTLCLSLFYSLAPILFRLASAAVFNIGNLTANFWAVLIGTRVFGMSVHWMYPPAFVLIVAGLVVYFVAAKEGVFADSYKPWLGDKQERGINGIGTARRRVEDPDTVV